MLISNDFFNSSLLAICIKHIYILLVFPMRKYFVFIK